MGGSGQWGTQFCGCPPACSLPSPGAILAYPDWTAVTCTTKGSVRWPGSGLFEKSRVQKPSNLIIEFDNTQLLFGTDAKDTSFFGNIGKLLGKTFNEDGIVFSSCMIFQIKAVALIR